LALTFGHLIGSNYFGKGKQMVSHGVFAYTLCDIARHHMKSVRLNLAYRLTDTMSILCTDHFTYIM